MEKSFVMIKPDGVQRELIGEKIGRFEKKGVKIIGLKLMILTKENAERHYDCHKDKKFFEDLIRFITYNRRIFIAKYLFENKICSIFASVR